MPPKKKEEEEEDEEEEEAEDVELPDPQEFDEGPKTLTVAPWSECPTVESALTHWRKGDFVWIEKGTYAVKSITQTMENTQDEEHEIESSFNGLMVHADPEATAGSPVVTLTGSPTFLIDTASFKNVRFKGAVTLSFGAIEFHHCVFDASDTAGYAIYINHSATPSFVSCTFLGGAKGCVYCHPHSGGSFQQCTMSGRKGQGVGIALDHSVAKFTQCIVNGVETGCFITSSEPPVSSPPVPPPVPPSPSEGENPTTPDLPPEPQTAVLSGCEFRNIGHVGVWVLRAGAGLFKRLVVTDAELYGVLIDGPSASPSFIAAEVHAPWRVKQGNKPTLFQNICHSNIIFDDPCCQLRGISKPAKSEEVLPA